MSSFKPPLNSFPSYHDASQFRCQKELTIYCATLRRSADSVLRTRLADIVSLQPQLHSCPSYHDASQFRCQKELTIYCATLRRSADSVLRTRLADIVSLQPQLHSCPSYHGASHFRCQKEALLRSTRSPSHSRTFTGLKDAARLLCEARRACNTYIACFAMGTRARSTPSTPQIALELSHQYRPMIFHQMLPTTPHTARLSTAQMPPMRKVVGRSV